MFKLTLLFLVLFVSGCSSYKELKGPPENGSFGYSEQNVNDRVYLVRVDGKDSEDYKALRVKLVRRSAEICLGSFELSQYTKNLGFVIHAKRTHWHYVTAKLACTADAIDNSVLFSDHPE